MKKVSKLLTLSATALLLLFAVSCSNKTNKHISKMEDFVKKWEEKTSQEKLSDDEQVEINKDYDELKRSESELKDSQPDLDQAKKMEELTPKIARIHFNSKYGNPSNYWKK